MKPCYLEFCGVNSFSEKTCVDFKRLLSGGIFGIFGDTGAGKSTILDCVGFALYGRVNRVGKDGAYISDIINYNCEKAYVIFEFESECNGERACYRVERYISRTRPPKASLYKQEEKKWTAVCEASAQVTKKIEEEIIGIRFEDFKKCIALPQGEFSQFLQSARKDRLALVAKLFSLEQYGFVLAQKIKRRLDVKNTEIAALSGQLTGYEEVSEESLQALAQEIAALTAEKEETRKACETAETDLRAYEERLKKKTELFRAESALSALNEKREEMDEKRFSIGKLQQAKRIAELEEELDSLTEKYAQSNAKAAGLRLREKQLSEETAQRREEEKILDFDGRIAAAREKKTRVEGARGEIEKLKDTERKLKDARAAYKAHEAEMKSYAGFDYTLEKRGLELALLDLPQENNLIDYIGNHFKSLLLQEEYAKFADELTALTEKYPVITPDAQPLIDKYASVGVAGGADIFRQAEYFRKCSAEKDKINKKLAALEVKNVQYLSAQKEEIRLRDEGSALKADYDGRKAVLEEVLDLGDIPAINEEIKNIEKEREKYRADYEKKIEQLTAIKSSLAAEEALKEKYAVEAREKREKLNNALSEGGMPEPSAARALLKKYGEPEKIRKETEAYFQRLYSAEETAKALRANTDEETARVSEEEFSQRKTQVERLKEKLRSAEAALAVKRSEEGKDALRLSRKRELEKQLKQKEREGGLLEKLRELVAKDKFMEFVAVEYLQEMAANANNLLLKLTGGRYFLVYDKNFEVGDNFNGGNLRGVHTLSGGEVFLVSLSLALSLSESIHRKSLRPAEFFFLDEGFGTLDGELVDTVMDSLEKLKNENFAIGIISHVEELKNRLENKIIVEKADRERGSSVRTC